MTNLSNFACRSRAGNIGRRDFCQAGNICRNETDDELRKGVCGIRQIMVA